MGIKDMLIREDFYEILRETVIQYARIVLRQDVKCDYSPFEGAEAWYINSLLGFVSRIPVPKGVRTYMKSEYNVRGSWLKNAIGKLAVCIITLFPILGTTKKIYISKGAFGKDVFIVPQNRSIRFYDYKARTVDCIVKAGFTSKYFDNQAEFRNRFRYGFLNPLLSQGEGWFREPVLFGHPLVRTTDRVLYEKGTEKALEHLRCLANETMEWLPAQSYIHSLRREAEDKIYLATVKKGIKEGEAAIQMLGIIDDLTRTIDTQIPTCVSHGDFQAGNIWIEPSGKTLVYDWETVGRRSVWYDSATLCYSLRRVYGWKSMLADCSGDGMRKCIPEGIDIQIDKKGIYGIVLLEDILFYLDDLLELPNDWGRESFDSFISNIYNLKWDQ